MAARKRNAPKKSAPKKSRSKARPKKARMAQGRPASARDLKTNVSPVPHTEHCEAVVGADRIAELFSPATPAAAKPSIWDRLWALIFGD